MREDLPLVTPVDLGLGPWNHLEPSVHARQFPRRDPKLLGDPRAGFLNVELDSLIAAREPLLPGQPLVDDRGLH